MNKHKQVRPTQKGKIITASNQREFAEAINANTKAIRGPREIQQKAEELGAIETNPDESPVIGNEVFDSTSITEQTVTGTDSNGDTIPLERTTQIVLQEQTSGRTMTWNITWPP